MKRLVSTRNVVFDASAKTITFSEYVTIYKEGILLVENVTDGIVIYDFDDQANLGGTVATNVLSLTYDTSSMADGDDLLIFYDDARNNNRVLTDWTQTAQNSISQSTAFTLKAKSLLHIQAFLDTTTAHTGTRFIVQVSDTLTGNEDWHDYTEFVGLIGTAATDLIEDNPLNAASTSIALTGHALTVRGKWLAIKDGTIANSELVFEVSSSANAVVILDGTTNSHALNTAIFNLAFANVVVLDSSVVRVRVLTDNSYDDNGSTVVMRLCVSW
jgi:hypothetical protein